jgi:hypothetical protein
VLPLLLYDSKKVLSGQVDKVRVNAVEEGQSGRAGTGRNVLSDEQQD